MILWVIEALEEMGTFDQIVISIERPDILEGIPEIASRLQSGACQIVQSQETLHDSVMMAMQIVGPTFLPFLITTGDNPLLTKHTLEEFMQGAMNSSADAVAALLSRDVLQPAYPDTVRTYLEFADGGYSGCNLFMLKTNAALEVTEIFTGGGQFGKRFASVLKAFGLGPLIHFILRKKSLHEFMEYLSNKWGTRVEAVVVCSAEAAIDVDKPSDYVIAKTVLQNRIDTAG